MQIGLQSRNLKMRHHSKQTKLCGSIKIKCIGVLTNQLSMT